MTTLSMQKNSARTLQVSNEVNTLINTLSKRECDIISSRFGLQGKNESTLEAIGQSYGITRERVRQIEAVVLKKLSKIASSNELKTFFIDASAILKNNGELISKEQFLDILSEKYNANTSEKRNFLHLALNLHPHIESVTNTIVMLPYYCSSAISSETVKIVANSLIRHVDKEGKPIDISSAIKIGEKNAKISLSERTVSNLVVLVRPLVLTKNSKVGLAHWSDINPRNIHSKIKFVLKQSNKPMHFRELTNSIKSENFDSKHINVQAVHNELIRNDEFVLIGRGIYALKEWGYKSGTVIELIAEMLKEGPLSRDEVVSRVMKQRQVKKVTIMINLKNKLKFERTGREMYALKN